MNDESTYIELIIKNIEGVLQWRPVSEWAEYDYKKLSDIIYQKTNTLISPLTLKRIFRNQPGTYNPKQGTKDAMAQFAGYPDWQSFIEAVHVLGETQNPISIAESGIPKTALPEIHPSKKSITGIFLVSGLLLFATAATVFFIYQNKKKYKADEIPAVTLFSDITFGDLPFTTTVHYDISAVKDENVFLSYLYNNKQINKLLDKNKHEINLSFELPGAYTIIVKTKEKNLKMTYITAKSKGWYGYYFTEKGLFGAYKKEYTSPLDTFLYDTIHDGYLYFPPSVMKEFGTDIRHPYFINNSNFDDFRVSGSNFSMEVRFRNALKEGGMSCQVCHFYILGDTGWIHVHLTNPESYSFALIDVTGNTISGETSNLKSLGVNMNEWGILKIIHKSSMLKLVYNNDTIYGFASKTSPGNIRQLTLVSQGSAKFDYIRLFDQNDSIVYCDDFD